MFSLAAYYFHSRLLGQLLISSHSPDRVMKNFVISSSEGTDDLPDLMSFISLLAGTLAMLFKYRLFAWVSLMAVIMYIANGKSESGRLSSLFTTAMFSIMALSMAYVGPLANQFS